MYEPQASYISGYINPGCNILFIDINEQYLEETFGEDISVSLVKEIREGEDISAFVAAEKYHELQAYLKAMM